MKSRNKFFVSLGLIILAAWFFASCNGGGPTETQGRIVFHSCASFDGDLDSIGVGSPAEICNGVAALTGLPGEYDAWVSSPAHGSPNTRFSKTPNVGYYLLSRSSDNVYISMLRIAENNAAFYSDSHSRPIDVGPDGRAYDDPTGWCISGGGTSDPWIWTNTWFDGTMASGAMMTHCDDWSSSDSLVGGIPGLAHAVNSDWSAVGGGGIAMCDSVCGLICVQQDTTPLDTMLLE